MLLRSLVHWRDHTIVRSAFSRDYIFLIVACILNEQSPRCYSQCKKISSYARLEV
jgi:hypothetical protein